jgi:hypothetical protein
MLGLTEAKELVVVELITRKLSAYRPGKTWGAAGFEISMRYAESFDGVA